MLKSTDTSLLETSDLVAEKPSRALGVMLIFKRQKFWDVAKPEARQSFDLSDAAILKRWERRLCGRIYRVYGSSFEAGWEFFALLEFEDLEAWQRVQQYLDTSGFSAYYVWEVATLGRQMG